MTLQKFCAIGTILALSACTTAQENPNYQFSSKYEGETPATQMAANSLDSNAVYVSPEARAAQLNGMTDQSISQAQVSYANSSTVQNDYPEQVNVFTPGQVGTPGYGVYVPENVENYDYSENVVSTSNQYAVNNNAEEMRSLQGSFEAQPSVNYIVGSGDTVYNISRRLCVDVEEVQAPNALGNDFAINIGQPLYLPPSRC